MLDLVIDASQTYCGANGGAITMSGNEKIPGAGSKRGGQQQLYLDQPNAKVQRVLGQLQDGYEKDQHADSANLDSNNLEDDWTTEQHKEFVSSVFEIGLKHASPAIILENMTQKFESITSERVKSKLQKYRSNKNKAKSKEEFMKEYSEFLERLQSIQAERNRMAAYGHKKAVGDSNISQQILEAIKAKGSETKLLLGGDVAGLLTYSVIREDQEKSKSDGHPPPDDIVDSGALSLNTFRKGAREYVENHAGSSIQFPVLTETEKKSSLGIAMTFIAGLFLTMSQHLTTERARVERMQARLPASATMTRSSSTSKGDGATSQKDL